uniref:Uncharacterized protein n=1 Tax=Melanopsichium pennsylvanicum 4 TaxID=1398559 RepID=A0A077RBU5_9BASI|nr:uncharacterized protein BN887_04878 [Melanopsichium pennsylvanicum 4]
MSGKKGAATQAFNVYGLARRPDGGNKSGRPISLSTNLFAANIGSNALASVQQLHVEISGVDEPSAQRGPSTRANDTLPPPINREVISYALRSGEAANLGITPEFANLFAYDGRSLAWTVVPLPTNQIEFETVLPPKTNLAPIPGAPAAVAPSRPPAPAGRAGGRERRF